MRGVLATFAGAILLAGCITSSGGSESTLGAPPSATASNASSQPKASGDAIRPIRVAGSVTPAANGGYRIGALDVLDISVFQVPDLTKTVQVSDTGTINLPLVGEVSVAGKTPQEVELDLTARLGAKYLQNPQVTVYVKEYNSQQITVEGSVKKPGVIPIKGKTSLLQLIAMADGFDPNSDWTVLVLRETNGRRSAAKFDVDAIQKGRADDPLLQSGDIVVAGNSAIKAGYNAILKALPMAGLFAFL
jgi:polysaccharide export outer membrane protein